jgi:RING finger/CHY zinc finger protein 1
MGDAGAEPHGCAHYRSRAQLLAPCCGEWFACRLCHDEARSDGERDPKKAHVLDRRAVARVRCTGCATEQPPAAACAGCGAAFAAYFCAVCNLYDDGAAERGVWHCAGCGICRAGGADNFFHCDACAACLAVATRGAHRCIGDALRGRCPVCQDDMFASRIPSAPLPCGHMMHRPCIDALLQGGQWRCPQCNRAAVDMRGAWARLDAEVAATPLPAELASKRVVALCSDCNTETVVPFHVVGLKCGGCGSYNTACVRDAAGAEP